MKTTKLPEDLVPFHQLRASLGSTELWWSVDYETINTYVHNAQWGTHQWPSVTEVWAFRAAIVRTVRRSPPDRRAFASSCCDPSFEPHRLQSRTEIARSLRRWTCT